MIDAVTADAMRATPSDDPPSDDPPSDDPPGAGAPLDVFELARRLLPGVELTPGQLAGVRAANTRLYTELAALARQATAEGRAWTSPSPAERAALLAMLVAELRDLLRPEQRAAFERGVARQEG